MQDTFANKTILVTGGTGTIGSELVTQLLTFKPRQIRVLSRDESKQYYLMEQLGHNPRVRFFIGDIRDRDRLDFACQNVDIIFHAAALKHVPLCEYNPFEAVKTNIVGSQNVIDTALKHNVDKVVAISTDKAVNPGNIMGITKLMMEKLVINANFYRGSARTKFSCVRFGNVTWARGSVFPLWSKQVERGEPIKVTNGQMTRFLMSKHQAIELVLKAAKLSHGSEIFIFKMPSITIKALAQIFLKKYFPRANEKIKVIGERPGEKKHEELFTPNFKIRAIYENSDMLILIPDMIIPDLKQVVPVYPNFRPKRTIKAYSSKNSINPKKIAAMI